MHKRPGRKKSRMQTSNNAENTQGNIFMKLKQKIIVFEKFRGNKIGKKFISNCCIALRTRVAAARRRPRHGMKFIHTFLQAL